MRTLLLVLAFSFTLTAASAAQESGTYTFLTLAGADTVASEVVQRTPTSFTGDLIDLTAGNRYGFTIDLGADGRADSIQSSGYRLAEPDSGAWESTDATFLGDSIEVRIQLRRSGRHRTLKVPSRPGAVPFISPSSISLEQVLRQARGAGAGPDTVPIFNVNSGQTSPAVVQWTVGDSARVTLGDIEVHAKVSKDGSVLGYTLPKQGSRVIRVSGAHPVARHGGGG